MTKVRGCIARTICVSNGDIANAGRSVGKSHPWYPGAGYGSCVQCAMKYRGENCKQFRRRYDMELILT